MNKKILTVAIVALLLDQITKLIISNFISLNESITIIDNFFTITYVTNSGGAWSILSNHTFILILVAIFAVGLILKYMNGFQRNWRNNLGFGLMLGGISGNLLDRIVFYSVKDFFSFRFFGYYFPVFNIADVCMCIGVIFLVIAVIKGEDNEVKSRRK